MIHAVMVVFLFSAWFVQAGDNPATPLEQPEQEKQLQERTTTPETRIPHARELPSQNT